VKTKPPDIIAMSKASDVAINAVTPALRAYALFRLRSGAYVDDAVKDALGVLGTPYNRASTFKLGYMLSRRSGRRWLSEEPTICSGVDVAEAARLSVEPD
jgi:hypothetical protein